MPRLRSQLLKQRLHVSRLRADYWWPLVVDDDDRLGRCVIGCFILYPRWRFLPHSDLSVWPVDVFEMTPAVNPNHKKQRILVSLAVALVSGILCWLMLSVRGQMYTPNGTGYYGGDFGWSYNAAREFLSGLDPYRHPPTTDYGPYPFPAVVLVMPLLIFTPNVAAALFFGASSGLMAYGLTREGWRYLLVFTCCPYWTALQWAQWSPMIFAAAFFPVLAFTVCIKPQIALPVVLTRLNRTMVISASALLVLSLVVYPSWPLRWLKGVGGYQGYWAFLTLPGPLLLLASRRWRERDAQLLILASLFPQRWFYDALILWLIPKTRKELLYTSAFSWIAFLWLLVDGQESGIVRSSVCVISFHLPMLVTILRRPRPAEETEGIQVWRIKRVSG